MRFIFGVYLFFLLGVAATVTNPGDPDLWHRLAVGEFLWQKGHFPMGDTFSYLADYKQIADHEWGCALIFYALWQLGGPTAMVIAKLVALSITLALVVLAGIGSRRPMTWMAGFYAVVILALLPSFQSTVRCMVFTHIFFALWLYWFQQERRGYRVSNYLYVVTAIIWANLHGGFVIGLAWLLLVTLVEAFQGGLWAGWLVRFGLCGAATLVNPFGCRLWITTGRALTTTRHGFEEWAPVAWTSAPQLYVGYKLLFISVLAGIVIQIYRKGWREIDQAAVILIGAFALLAMTSARHTSLFAVVAGALWPGFIGDDWNFVRGYHPLRRLGVMGLSAGPALLAFFVALRLIPDEGLRLEYPHVAYPVDAVAYLQRQDIRGNLLVPFNYGSYALWELRGQMRVSMDGRYDLVYRPETYRRVDNFFAARGDWQSLLISSPPNAILVPRSDDVYVRLLREPGWKEAWRDPWDAVFLPLR